MIFIVSTTLRSVRENTHPMETTVSLRFMMLLKLAQFPRSKYNPNNLVLQVVRVDKTFNKSYATFLHVGINGFGNSSKNERHHCQLQRFHKLLRDA